jgi:hypothetical protein
MNRRHLLKLLLTGAAGHVLDVDKILWVPGAKTFFLPPEKILSGGSHVGKGFCSDEVLDSWGEHSKMLQEAISQAAQDISDRIDAQVYKLYSESTFYLNPGNPGPVPDGLIRRGWVPKEDHLSDALRYLQSRSAKITLLPNP